MAVTQKADLANTIVEVIAKEGQMFLRNRLYLARLVNRDYSKEVKEKGDTVGIKVYGTFDAVDVPEDGSKVATQKMVPLKKQMKLDRHITVPIAETDLANIISNGEEMDKFIEAMFAPLAEQVEEDLFNLRVYFTHGISSTGTIQIEGTTGDSKHITSSTLTTCDRHFEESKCPKSGRIIITSTFDKKYMLDDDKLTRADWIDDKGEAIKTGYIGEKYGMSIFTSNLVPKTDNGTDTRTYHNVAMHKNAMGLVTRALKQQIEPPGVLIKHVVDDESQLVFRLMISYDHLAFTWYVTLDCLYGVGILLEDFGVDVESQEKYA